MDRKEYYECDCSDFDHILRVSYFEDVTPDKPDFLYIEVHLRQKTFFKRLWSGLSYIFGRRSRYGDFDEFLWTPETAKRFADHCMRYHEAATKDREDIKE